jgi:hypothetical protein
MTCQAVQRMHKAYKKSPTRKQLSFIFRANTCLAAQHSINKHTITGLITLLKHEKTKRRCRKQLNLVGEEDNRPQFFGLSEVLCAKSYVSEKEAQEQAKRDRIEASKVTAAANKVHKEQEKAERALQTAKRRRLAAKKKI